MIEHVVLFNIKDETDPTLVTAWINGLNSLSSLKSVLHLTAGPVLRTRSPPDDDDNELDTNPNPLRFTHLLHARYTSLTELHAYTTDPAHQHVVNVLGQPIMNDITAFDWATTNSDDHVTHVDAVPNPSDRNLQHPGPGRALRLTCFKFKEMEGKKSVMEGLKKIKDECKEKFVEMSFGEELSINRAKGYSVIALVTFSDLNELDACEEYEDKMRTIIDRVKNEVDGIISVDYLVPRR